MRPLTESDIMGVMISASGARIGWADLPSHVRGAVEEVLGAPVVEACTQPGGFSPGSADRVLTRDGRRAFVKAAGAEQNEKTIELHRREAAVTAGLPATVPAPVLLGVHDDGQWVALVFDDVAGHQPRTPWVAHEIDAVMAALAQVAAATEVRGLLPDVRMNLPATWQGGFGSPPIRRPILTCGLVRGWTNCVPSRFEVWLRCVAPISCTPTSAPTTCSCVPTARCLSSIGRGQRRDRRGWTGCSC